MYNMILFMESSFVRVTTLAEQNALKTTEISTSLFYFLD